MVQNPQEAFVKLSSSQDKTQKHRTIRKGSRRAVDEGGREISGGGEDSQIDAYSQVNLSKKNTETIIKKILALKTQSI